MNYGLGRYFYKLSLVALTEAHNAYDTGDFHHYRRANRRATNMYLIAEMFGYTSLDYEWECWEEEGLI